MKKIFDKNQETIAINIKSSDWIEMMINNAIEQFGKQGIKEEEITEEMMAKLLVNAIGYCDYSDYDSESLKTDIEEILDK